MHLYEQIKSNFILPNAHLDWKDYRNTLTQYLITQTNEVELPLSFHTNTNPKTLFPTLAILGAGTCNDLDLAKLIPYFSKITLIDYDQSAMKTALETYHITSSQIEIIPLSLNGITETDYNTFCNSLQKYSLSNQSHLSHKDFQIFALTQIQNLYNKQEQKDNILSSLSYDYIWCFGLHSQFQSMFSYIYHVFELNLKHLLISSTNFDSNLFSNYLKDQNNQFIPLFHDSLLKSAKKGIFLGLEEHRLNDDSAIEGAYQGIEDIRNRNLNCCESHILWPFLPAENISYQMLIQHIKL